MGGEGDAGVGFIDSPPYLPPVCIFDRFLNKKSSPQTRKFLLLIIFIAYIGGMVITNQVPYQLS